MKRHIFHYLSGIRSRVANERRKSLVQTIDLPVTLLEFFDWRRPGICRDILCRR